MSTTKKRIYNSTLREAKAQETRKRILKAAQKLFSTKGFEGVTIDKLAQTADVSVPTVYSLFQSKSGVLRALMDEALSPEIFQALVQEAKAAKSPKARLKISAKIARQMYDAESAQMALFQGAVVLAPEFKQLEKEREKRRFVRQEETILTMAKEKSLAKGLVMTKARDILWAFTGRDLYRMLVIEQKWTSEEYETWLGEILIKNLLAE